MARYLGIEYLTMWVPGTYTYEDYMRLNELADKQGVKIGPCSSISNNDNSGNNNNKMTVASSSTKKWSFAKRL